jgi:triphosphoribosyl-dephospho-CoA synthase
VWPETEVARAATLACRLEAGAQKPGNVFPRRPVRGVAYEDFLASADAVGPVLGGAGERPVGGTVLRAVEATRAVVRTNTNLGTVLLLAPLARAARRAQPGGTTGGRQTALRTALREVLAALDVEDARLAYRAIRLAEPGGLGRRPEQDVAAEPDVTLLEAMRLAAERDSVAREYVTDFETTFGTGLPLLREPLVAGLPLPAAAVELYLELLRRLPDSLVERKFGRDAATEVSERAGAALEAGARGSEARARAVGELDAWLRDESRGWNPGTTADLVAGVLFVWLLTADDSPLRAA